jgi:hypothetical protein
MSVDLPTALSLRRRLFGMHDGSAGTLKWRRIVHSGHVRIPLQGRLDGCTLHSISVIANLFSL